MRRAKPWAEISWRSRKFAARTNVNTTKRYINNLNDIAGQVAAQVPHSRRMGGHVELAAMIAADRIDQTFRQSCGSCVLAAYGIAYHYFTGRPVAEVFAAYCRHFGIESQDPERAYASHFDGEWRRLKVRGNQVVEQLHHYSADKVFSAARDRFGVEFILNNRARMRAIVTARNDIHLRTAFLSAPVQGTSGGRSKASSRVTKMVTISPVRSEIHESRTVI